MSFLQNHHIIPQLFADNEIIGELVRQRLFDLEGGSNRIYLPAAPELAASMGLSAHSGGHLDSYYNGVSGALGALADETDPAARASKLSDLVDSMRVALASGHLYANVPARMTQDEVDSKNRDFFGDWSGYAKAHKDQIAAVRALEQQGADSQQPGLVKWSAIINDPQRVLQLKGAIAKNPGVNITAGNQDLGGTPFAKFAVTDSIPDLPGSTPLRSNDLPPLPGLLPQTDTFGLPGFSAPKAIPSLPGFTPSNPFLQLPGFPPAQAGFAGPQTLTRSPAQIVSDDFATASQARLNDTFTAPTEPGLESGDAIFALLPLILAAAPELAAGAPAVLARVAARGPIEAAATRVSQAGAGGGLIEAAKRAAQAATGGGLFAAATPSPAMETPVGPPTPNQIVADDFQSLERTSAGSPLTPLDRSEPDSRPFAMRAVSPMAPATDESNKNNPENQRRVADLTDEINGGPGRVIQIPATLNRAAQLAGLPNGGITLGQRTGFPPRVVSTDFSGLPAVLRGVDTGFNVDSQVSPWLWDYYLRGGGDRRALTDRF